MSNRATTRRTVCRRNNLQGVLLVNLSEHHHGVVPYFDRLKLQPLVYLGDHDPLKVNHAAMRLDLNFLSLAKPRSS